MIRPQKIIRGGPRDSLAVWKDIISHLLPAQKGSLEVERTDGSRPGRIQEVQTALLEGEREWKRKRESSLKNYDINASSLEINASGPDATSNKSNVTEANVRLTHLLDIENLSYSGYCRT